MNPSQIRLVQDSFAQLAPDADLLADLLCARLFQLEPSLRTRLPNDLQETKADIVRLLTESVQKLDRPGEWQPALRQIGIETGIGTYLRNYQVFGTALIWTLEKGMGEEFTFEMLEAWVAFYSALTGAMQETDAQAKKMANA